MDQSKVKTIRGSPLVNLDKQNLKLVMQNFDNMHESVKVEYS